MISLARPLHSAPRRDYTDPMQNPLLDFDSLPPFDRIRAEHALPAVREVIEDNRAELARLLAAGTASFESLVLPMEELAHRLNRAFSPVGHLNAVANSEPLREAYGACLPLLTEYSTELSQNSALCAAYRKVLDSSSNELEPAQKRILDNALRDFRLAGVDLPEERKARFRAVMTELAQRSNHFAENVLDSAKTFEHWISGRAALEGLPDNAIERAAADAASLHAAPDDSSALPRAKTADDASVAGAVSPRSARGSWLLKLDQPTYSTVMTCAHNEPLRRALYVAWVTRASPHGPGGARFDNSASIEAILALRHEAAQLAGFAHFADFALATRMAKSSAQVLEFLYDLAQRCRPAAAREFAELEEFAGRKLSAWDVPYTTERLKAKRFQVSQEALRPYFPLPKVLSGLFELVRRLYGVSVRERPGVAVWHPSARFYDLADAEGRIFAGFYLDPYSRAEKRSGAWMDDCVGRKSLPTGSALPIAQLVCNFTPPVAGKPSLLTHDEVTTLFHEFGHGLHHMLTRVQYPSIAGINGVPWDAVELPSQFMENFAWRPEVLPLISAHIESGEPLPQPMLERLLGSRTFGAALDTLRQLELACFDFELHAQFDPRQGARIDEILAQVRARVAVVPPADFNRFALSFSHIFAGGYAAGYYSYKWAEVLAADAFEAFEEAGVLDNQVAKRFVDCVLSQGGSRDAMEAFVAFRGRAPNVEPLLRRIGVAA